jgi:hypothetical protein
MPHPFFDADEFPLYRPEAVRLLNCLIQVCPEVPRIELYYAQSQADLPPLVTHQTPPDIIWSMALKHLTIARALRSFCGVMQRTYSVGTLREVIEVIIAAQAEPLHITVPNPVDILVLDRQTLRAHLAKLASSTSLLKVLLVTGEARSGKSHSHYLFVRLAELRRANSLYIRAGQVATVEDVVQALYTALGVWDNYPTQDTSYTTDEAWYRDVCYQLLARATSQGRRLWIAVDDLGVDADGIPLMDQRIRDFFNHFVLHMDNPAFQQAFRLMLIDYPPGATPAKWNPNVWRIDQLTVAGITGQHVEEALQYWAADQQRQIFDQQIKQLATGVMEEAQAQQQTQRLQCIAARVQHYMETL